MALCNGLGGSEATEYSLAALLFCAVVFMSCYGIIWVLKKVPGIKKVARGRIVLYVLMEGYLRVCWQGDKAAWEGLLRNSVLTCSSRKMFDKQSAKLLL